MPAKINEGQRRLREHLIDLAWVLQDSLNYDCAIKNRELFTRRAMDIKNKLCDERPDDELPDVGCDEPEPFPLHSIDDDGCRCDSCLAILHNTVLDMSDRDTRIDKLQERMDALEGASYASRLDEHWAKITKHAADFAGYIRELRERIDSLEYDVQTSKLNAKPEPSNDTAGSYSGKTLADRMMQKARKYANDRARLCSILPRSSVG